MGRVYFILSVDVECDKSPDWSVRKPLSFRSVVEGIPSKLMPLCQTLGLKPTLLLSPEVLRDDKSVQVLGKLEHCELGAHCHVEFLEPGANLEGSRTDGVLCGLDPALELAKLKDLTELFQRRLGRKPLSFRAGRFALSPRTLAWLAELGYKVDSSVTPFRSWHFGDGLLVNYWGAPWEPYRPSHRDCRREGSLPIWEVPVSIVDRTMVNWPRFLLRRFHDRSPWLKRWLPRLGLSPKPVWLRPLRSTPEEMKLAADAIVASGRGSATVLNVMFHSVELIAGASPYAQTEREVEELLDSVRSLANHVTRRHGACPVTLGELAGILG